MVVMEQRNNPTKLQLLLFRSPKMTQAEFEVPS